MALRYVPEGVAVTEVYITTGDIKLAPSAPQSGTARVILVAKQHSIVGGNPGATIVVSDYDTSLGQPHYEVMVDPLFRSPIGLFEDLYCPFLSAAVQQQYYPGVC